MSSEQDSRGDSLEDFPDSAVGCELPVPTSCRKSGCDTTIDDSGDDSREYYIYHGYGTGPVPICEECEGDLPSDVTAIAEVEYRREYRQVDRGVGVLAVEFFKIVSVDHDCPPYPKPDSDFWGV